MNVNGKLAEIRSEADACRTASKNLSKDAASMYARADRIWAANLIAEKIRGAFYKKGPMELDPEMIDEVIDLTVEEAINEGLVP